MSGQSEKSARADCACVGQAEARANARVGGEKRACRVKTTRSIFDRMPRYQMAAAQLSPFRQSKKPCATCERSMVSSLLARCYLGEARCYLAGSRTCKAASHAPGTFHLTLALLMMPDQ